jgi:hypothetical protein
VGMGAYLNVISALNLNFHLAARGDVGYEGKINRVGQLLVRISYLVSRLPSVKRAFMACLGC